MRLSQRTLQAYLPALVLSAVLSGGPLSAAVSAADSTATANAALSAIRIDNFGRVNDEYYRGGQPAGDDFKALSNLGVKMVIDLAAEGDSAEEANARAAGMHFVRIPMTTHQVPTPAMITQFLSLVSDPANQPVYVHCMGGRHRTGVMTAIYRMTLEQWNAARAFQEMKHYKFGADFLHPEFKQFVETYVPDPLVAPVLKHAAK
jgi:protein tyrosine/serine phosphatase